MSRKSTLLDNHADLCRTISVITMRSIDLRGRDVVAMQAIQKKLLECLKALEEMMNATKKKNTSRNK